jgi:peroxiredoxin
MTRRLLALILTAAFFFPLPSQAQADERGALAAFTALFNQAKAKPDDATLASLRAAGVNFLADFPKSGRANAVIKNMLDTAGFMSGKNDGPRRLSWFSMVQFDVVGKLHSGQQVGNDTKAALSALDVAMVQGETRERIVQLQQGGTLGRSSTEAQRMLAAWRGKIDALTEMPGGAGLRYLKDREEGFYDFVSLISPATTEAQLNHLVNSKDRTTANWAKTESVWFALRKAPFDLKFTELDARGKGREVDFKKLQGKVVYLYFWTTDAKGAAADIDKILDAYFDTSRRKFEVIGVCCDPEEKRAEALEFIRKNKMKWPQYFDGKGAGGELCGRFNVKAFPTGFIFETTGKLGPVNIKGAGLKPEVTKRVR